MRIDISQSARWMNFSQLISILDPPIFHPSRNQIENDEFCLQKIKGVAKPAKHACQFLIMGYERSSSPFSYKYSHHTCNNEPPTFFTSSLNLRNLFTCDAIRSSFHTLLLFNTGRHHVIISYLSVVGLVP